MVLRDGQITHFYKQYNKSGLRRFIANQALPRASQKILASLSPTKAQAEKKTDQCLLCAMKNRAEMTLLASAPAEPC